MAKKRMSSIEESVEQWAKEQLKDIKLYPKTDFINPQIEKALKLAPSKKGGKGPNYPDIKCLFQTSGGDMPVMIEVKGLKGALIKLDSERGIPDNTTKKGEPNYTNIDKYAVNGAVHYSNAILRYTNYNEVLAVGVNGFIDEEGETVYEVSVWYLSRKNLFYPKQVGLYSDLSILTPANRNRLFEIIAKIDLTETEIENLKSNLEDDIERKLKDLNQKMEDELNIVVNQRVQLVTGLIMAGLGVKEENSNLFKVKPLQEEDLHGDIDEDNNDGTIIMRKIKSYLKDKKLPSEKITLVANILSVVFEHSNLHIPINGESHLRTLYRDIKADIIPFLTGELHNLDFTGRLFNVLNAWVAVPDGDKNDVVLTPRYVTELMAKLCQVDMDSYVWDFATGSAGFLISAMHQMIADANKKISSPDKLQKKINHIKMEQLLGIEKLAEIYLLAVLNMILMKDGSANIIKGNSLTEFHGKYEQGKLKGQTFPANVFLLNPPYSEKGKGLIFVERALKMMTHGGMAAILIQENAGDGNGLPYAKNILEKNTLVASIKMPKDLFIGKSTVQTAIYVFEVGKSHKRKSIVKFIDFSDDGYTRTNRRHSSQSINLRDTNNALERYAEVVRLVNYGKGLNNENLNLLKDSYIEDYITLDGNDWTYGHHKKIEKIPTEFDFRNTISEHLAWEVSIIPNDQNKEVFYSKLKDDLKHIKWGNYKIKNLFKSQNGNFDIQKKHINGKGEIVITSGLTNHGIMGRSDVKARIFKENTITIDMFGNAYYRRFPYKLVTHARVFSLEPKFQMSLRQGLFIVNSLSYLRFIYSYDRMCSWEKIKEMDILLPCTTANEIDYKIMDTLVREMEEAKLRELEASHERELEAYKIAMGIE